MKKENLIVPVATAGALLVALVKAKNLGVFGVGATNTERQLEFDFGDGFYTARADLFGDRGRRPEYTYSPQEFDDYMAYLKAGYGNDFYVQELLPWERARLRLFLRQFPEVARDKYGFTIL